nr:hypothetical protein [uncultured Shewanella sp.]
MRAFTTTSGVVTVYAPFWSIHFDQQQVEVTYKPNNYHGWGIVRTCNAVDCQDFNQADADKFALNAESKLRINGDTSCAA